MSFGRTLIIALFSLSCFGLLLFLWLSFGGPVPLNPKGYTVKVSFPEATQLAEQADVRVAGVSVGKVVAKERDPDGNRTLATLQLDSKLSPLRADARAILRQKTLLGETYVELTRGTEGARALPEGGRLEDANVAPTVELDEVLRIFDKPTQDAFRSWQKELASASRDRGQNFNRALGSLPTFTESATDVLDVLDDRRTALRALIQDTGTTFAAITQDEGALTSLITQTAEVFDATARQREALAETFQIAPTFLDESKATLRRVREFGEDTDPLLVELEPALADLNPALRDVGRLAPELQSIFGDLDDLFAAGREGLPALTSTLRGLRPFLADINPFLNELTPILQYVELNQPVVSDFINLGASALAIKPPSDFANTQGHALPQLITLGSQTLNSLTTRSQDNRGNSYWAPGILASPKLKEQLTLPSWDCKHVGVKGPTSTPACYEQGPIPFNGLNQKFPHVRSGAETGANESR